MGHPRKPGFCKRCQARVIFSWQEPPHTALAALTVAMIGGGFVTLSTGGLLTCVWMAEVVASQKWACSYCGSRATSLAA